MNDLKDLSPLNKEMPYCVGDYASDEEKKKGIHDIRYSTVYPAYPWKFDKDADHSKDNAKVFSDIAKQSGVMRDVRAEDRRNDDRPISYSQWVERHRNEPGWVNHLEDKIIK